MEELSKHALTGDEQGKWQRDNTLLTGLGRMIGACNISNRSSPPRNSPNTSTSRSRRSTHGDIAGKAHRGSESGNTSATGASTSMSGSSSAPKHEGRLARAAVRVVRPRYGGEDRPPHHKSTSRSEHQSTRTTNGRGDSTRDDVRRGTHGWMDSKTQLRTVPSAVPHTRWTYAIEKLGSSCRCEAVATSGTCPNRSR